jgi:hypothetical protein
MRFPIIFTALMFAISAARADLLSPRAFTDAFAAAMSAANPSAKVTVTDDLQLEIRPAAGGGSISGNLGNAYGLYVEAPARLNDVIHVYVSNLKPSGLVADAYFVDRSHILPVVKSRKWFDETEAALRGNGTELRRSPDLIAGELVVVYVMDNPGTMRFLMARDDVGDPAKLGDLAVENLERLLPKIEMRGADQGLWLISAGGDYGQVIR